MRVVHLIQGYAPAETLGGPVESTRILCEGLLDEGLDLAVLTTMQGQAPGSPVRAGSGWQSWNSVPVRYCKESPGWGFSTEFLGQLRPTMAGADVVHITGTFSLEAIAGMAMAILQGRPYIVSPRGSLEPWALSTKRWKKSPALTLLRPLLLRASAIHATSDMEARGLEAFGVRVPVAVVPNPIAHPPELGGDRGTWRTALKVDEHAPLLLILGRVHPVKGIDIAIRALRLAKEQLPSAVLVIAGPGQPRYEHTLMDLARSLGVESSVLRVPLTKGADKYRLLRDADLLLLPSRQENFGNVVAEALSVGTPVIASRATPWEALEQSRCGRWVPLEPEAFANAIVELIMDRGQLDAARIQAVVEVEKYSPSRIVKSMIDVYRACATGQPIPSQVGSRP